MRLHLDTTNDPALNLGKVTGWYGVIFAGFLLYNGRRTDWQGDVFLSKCRGQISYRFSLPVKER